MLEANIVCSNGFSISIATEWIRNPEHGNYEKQDCELKAFVRLVEKLKKQYPHMPILADGLYPNNTVFDTCRKCGYRFILTFKDGNLKSVWEEIDFLSSLGRDEQYKRSEWQERVDFLSRGNKDEHFEKRKWREEHSYRFIPNIPYKNHTLHLVELNIMWEQHTSTETITHTPEKMRFVHITDILTNEMNYRQISEHGRLRWNIENEGFNAQKNQGYGLSHKFSRVSHVATCNYYQCLQIAHMIDQLA